MAGIVLGALTVFIIDRAFKRAAEFALADAILTFFGFIHGPDGIGIGQSPVGAVSCLAVAGILFHCARFAEFLPAAMNLHQAAEAD